MHDKAFTGSDTWTRGMQRRWPNGERLEKLNSAHFKGVLSSYADYYKRSRSHQSLDNSARSPVVSNRFQPARRSLQFRTLVVCITGMSALLRYVRRPVLAFAMMVSCCAASFALVGGAAEIPSPKTQPEVMLVGSRGNFCTGVLIASDLVLTAAHCVQPGADYKRVEVGPDRQPVFTDIVAIARHPQFNLKAMLAHRATADVAKQA